MDRPIPISCKTACTAIGGRLPYHWDLNVYRGCSHDCKYCYARYSHRYLQEKGGFAEQLYVKENIAEALERQLRNPKWDRSVINLGGVTDSYQPAEEREKKMPEILRLMIRYKNPIIISTKSDLILRDYDLIDELSRLVYVNVASTVTTANDSLQKKLEPGAVDVARRFRMLKEFGKTKASTAVHMMPLMPYLTDGEENLRAVFQGAKEAEVSYLLAGFLNLRGETRNVFLDFLNQTYPNLLSEYAHLYSRGGLKEYKKPVFERLGRIRREFGVSGDYMSRIRREVEVQEGPKQLSLFD